MIIALKYIRFYYYSSTFFVCKEIQYIKRKFSEKTFSFCFSQLPSFIIQKARALHSGLFVKQIASYKNLYIIIDCLFKIGFQINFKMTAIILFAYWIFRFICELQSFLAGAKGVLWARHKNRIFYFLEMFTGRIFYKLKQCSCTNFVYESGVTDKNFLKVSSSVFHNSVFAFICCEF